jgi:signal transduction histidine kinase
MAPDTNSWEVIRTKPNEAEFAEPEMARVRLQSQLLISTLLILCALTGAILLILRQTVRSEIAVQVRESTNASVREFNNIQRQMQLEQARTAAMLAELPTLKALMTTRDALTIQDGSMPFWKLTGSDLFLLANPEGKVMALNVTRPGMESNAAESRLMNSLEHGEDSAWWTTAGRLYWVFVRPITAGAGSNAKQLGWLVIGYEVNSMVAEQLALVADSRIVLTAGGQVIASSLTPMEEREVQRRIASQQLTATEAPHETNLQGAQYQVTSVALYNGPASPVECYVFVPLERSMAFLRRLNRTILIVGTSAVLLALLLLRFVSGTITRPLESLVAGVRALAGGNYTYSITPRGSSEVVELAEAFAKMRGELLASQQKEIETERVAALGRAAHTISHDFRHHLAALVANAEFLYEAEKLKLDRDQIYGEIQDAALQLTGLLDSLRDLALERRNISPDSASIDQTMRRAISAVRGRPELRDCSIEFNTTGDMTGVFDAKKMERVFFNLTLNACEATAARHGNIVITISSDQELFTIRVADDGQGIPAAIRGTLFDAFVSEGKANGTGLGLAIVSKIVRDHGGSVIVESTSQSGTVFLVQLPRSQQSVPGPTHAVTT